jgi:hypothetical protein
VKVLTEMAKYHKTHNKPISCIASEHPPDLSWSWNSIGHGTSKQAISMHVDYDLYGVGHHLLKHEDTLILKF